MKKYLCLILTFLLSVNYSYCDESPITITSLGKIIGHYKISSSGNKYEAYEGIPYAKPPIGDRRFQPPEPIESWKKDVTAKDLSKSCYEYERQKFDSGSYVEGTEDCLYLHLYKPITKNDTLLPVIVYIHGGAFQFGQVEDNEGKNLIDHEVIYVSINYRLGVLGFLSTEDEILPGNMGLKDQSMALKWIKDNVVYFNGDSNRITITGLSAGGASVHYHYLSPMSYGLFNNGISFSGTALDCWAQTENSRDKAIQLGKMMNCTVDDIEKMIECLKNVPARTLTQAQDKFMPWKFNPFTPFGPVVEKYSKNPFISKSPIEILNSGDYYGVPWITSIVSEEGLFPVEEFITNNTAFEDLDKNWEYIAPLLLDYYYTIPKVNHSFVAQKIRKYYFDDKPINANNSNILIQLVGDRIFGFDAEKAARYHAKNNNSIWFYYYSYRAVNSLTDDATNTTENFGVDHGDDVYLVFGTPYIDPTKSINDMNMQKTLINLWTTFARYGKPTVSDVKWYNVNSTKSNIDYLHIAAPDKIYMDNRDNFANKNFWNSIDFDENIIR